MELEKAEKMLLEEGYTCVLCHGDKVYTSTLRGVKPLVRWVEAKTDMTGFSAADKVVGRATAYLYVLLGIRELYARVISKAALEVLDKAGIPVRYETLAEYIVNRKGDGVCPFELAVMGIDAPDRAYVAIRQKMREMGIEL